MDLAMRERLCNPKFLELVYDEQVEEEASASDIVTRLEMISDSKNGLFMLDRELGSRE